MTGTDLMLFCINAYECFTTVSLITGLGTREMCCKRFFMRNARSCTNICVEQILTARRKTSEILDQLEKFEERTDIGEDFTAE